MITFPGCKINLGLSILNRREDNYHNIQTVMYPIDGLTDVVEILKSDESGCQFSTSGLVVDCDQKNNLCVRAYDLMRSRYGIGGVKMHLHKKVPFGAGLGGGSADAAAVLTILNELFELHLDSDELVVNASMLGSDIPFFIDSQVAVASGRGEILETIDLSLRGMRVVIIKPEVFVSTAAAYAGVVPRVPEILPKDVVRMPVNRWSELLVNDFERSIFEQFLLLGDLKKQLYEMGAVYAAMSGSGSAIYGLFYNDVQVPESMSDYFVYQGVLG